MWMVEKQYQVYVYKNLTSKDNINFCVIYVFFILKKTVKKNLDIIMNTFDRKETAIIILVIVASVLYLLYKGGYILCDTKEIKREEPKNQGGGRASYFENEVVNQQGNDTADIINEIENRRQFISGGDVKPDEYLPPKTLENTTEHDVLSDNCDNYVNSRIGMDTNAYLPRKSNSRTIYQAIAGDININSEPIVASRVISTYTPPTEGFVNPGNKAKVLDIALAQPY